jgi:hypothetical protein
MLRALRSHLARQARRRFQAAGLRGPDRVIDLSDLMELPGPAARIAALRHPGTVTEMFCQPGSEKADGDRASGVRRSAELKFLLSIEFQGLLHEAEVELVTYWIC